MKKYMVTQTQLEDIQAMLRWLCFGECRVTERAIPTSAAVVEMLYALKPIEPLEVDTINTLWQDAVNHSDPTAGHAHIKLVRSVEHHILNLNQGV